MNNTTTQNSKLIVSIGYPAARRGKIYKTLYGARAAAKAAALAPYENHVVVRKALSKGRFLGWSLDTNCHWIPEEEGFIDFYWGYRNW